MSASTERLEQQFANRFEPDGEAYVFRANLRAPGYPVSAADRDRLVANFKRDIVRALWGSSILALLIIGAVFWGFVATIGTVPDYAIWTAVPVIVAAAMAPIYWLWNAPKRALQAAQPVTAGRSRDESRRLTLSRLTWGQLGAGVAAAIFMLWRASTMTNILVGWGRLWLLADAALLALIAFQAVRKLRFDRERARQR